MKKIIFIVLIFTSCFQLSSFDVSGVWHFRETIHPDDKTDMIFSWGQSFMVRNSSIAIDYCSDNPRFYIGGFGDFPIKEINTSENGTIIMVFYFSRGGFDISCIIHPINDKQMWIEDIEGISMFPTGEERVYYKFDGPDFN